MLLRQRLWGVRYRSVNDWGRGGRWVSDTEVLMTGCGGAGAAPINFFGGGRKVKVYFLL